MKATCFALALGLLAGGASSQAGVERDPAVRDHDWRLSLTRDAFTGRTNCRLAGRDMRIDGAWVVFSLGRSVDTSDAYVRIDDAYARSIRDIAPGPYRADWSADEGVFNPSGGEVALPKTLLLHSKTVWIRASRHAAIRRFQLEGLERLLQLAADRGC